MFLLKVVEEAADVSLSLSLFCVEKKAAGVSRLL
jgi:hypothetical protein